MNSDVGYQEIQCNVLALSAYSGEKNKVNALKEGLYEKTSYKERFDQINGQIFYSFNFFIRNTSFASR